MSTFQFSPPKLSRSAERWLLIGVCLTLLGAGNYLYGSHKLNDYNRLLRLAHREELQRRSSTPRTASLLPRELSRLPKQSQTPQAQIRRDYYELVCRGGTWLMALGALAFLSSLLQFARRSSPARFPAVSPPGHTPTEDGAS